MPAKLTIPTRVQGQDDAQYTQAVRESIKSQRPYLSDDEVLSLSSSYIQPVAVKATPQETQSNIAKFYTDRIKKTSEEKPITISKEQAAKIKSPFNENYVGQENYDKKKAFLYANELPPTLQDPQEAANKVKPTLNIKAEDVNAFKPEMGFPSADTRTPQQVQKTQEAAKELFKNTKGPAPVDFGFKKDDYILAAQQAMPNANMEQKIAYANVLKANDDKARKYEAIQLSKDIADEDFNKSIQLDQILKQDRGTVLEQKYGGFKDEINKSIREYIETPQFKPDVVRIAKEKGVSLNQAAQMALDEKSYQYANAPSSLEKNMQAYSDWAATNNIPFDYTVGKTLTSAVKGLTDVGAMGAAMFEATVNGIQNKIEGNDFNFGNEFARRNAAMQRQSRVSIPQVQSEKANPFTQGVSDVTSMVAAIGAPMSVVPKVNLFSKAKNILSLGRGGEQALQQGLSADAQLAAKATTNANKLALDIGKILQSKPANVTANILDNTIQNYIVMGSPTMDAQRQKYLALGFSEEKANRRASGMTFLTNLALALPGTLRPNEMSVMDKVFNLGTFKEGAKAAVKQGVHFGLDMTGLRTIEEIADERAMRQNGIEVEKKPLQQELTDKFGHAAKDFAVGVLMSTMGRMKYKQSDMQLAGLAEAFINPEGLSESIKQSVRLGKTSKEEAVAFQSFLNTLKPEYDKAINETTKEGTPKFAPAIAAKVAIERIKQKQAEKALENLDASVEKKTIYETDKNGNVVEKTVYRHKDGKLYDTEEASTKGRRVSLLAAKTNAEQRARRLEAGYVFEGKLISGWEMADMVDANSLNGKAKEGQREDIVKNAPFEAVEDNVNKFKNDPKVAELVTQIEDGKLDVSNIEENNLVPPIIGIDNKGNEVIVDGSKTVAKMIVESAAERAGMKITFMKPIGEEVYKEAANEAFETKIGDTEPITEGLPENEVIGVKSMSETFDKVIENGGDAAQGLVEAAKEGLQTFVEPEIVAERLKDIKGEDTFSEPIIEAAINKAQKPIEAELGEPTITKVEDGELYEFKTKDGLVAGVMISPTEFRIDGISAEKVGEGQGSKMFESLIRYLDSKGVKTISTSSAGEGAKRMHDKAVENGILNRISEDGRNATFEIIKNENDGRTELESIVGGSESENQQSEGAASGTEQSNVRAVEANKEGQEYTTKNGKYKVAVDKGQLKVLDSEGKEINPSTAKQYLTEYKDNKVYDNEKDVNELTENVTDETSYYDAIAESENPAQVAAELETVPKYIPANELDFIESGIAQLISTVSREHYGRFGDPNNIAMSKAKAYLRKGGREIDTLAQEVESMLYGDWDAANPRVTEQDIINFIDKYPNGAQDFYKQKNPTFTKLYDRLEKLLGYPPSSKDISNAAKQYNKRLQGNEALQEPSSAESDFARYLAEENRYEVPESELERQAQLEKDFEQSMAKPTEKVAEPSMPKKEPTTKKDVEANVGDMVERTLVSLRLKDSSIDESVKQSFTYEESVRAIDGANKADANASQLIKDVGMDEAVRMAIDGEVKGALQSAILGAKWLEADTNVKAAATPEELSIAQKEYKNILEAIGKTQETSGAANAYWATFYAKNSDLGLTTEDKIARWEKISGQVASAEIREAYEKLDAKNKEQLAEIKKLKEQLESEALQEYIDEIKARNKPKSEKPKETDEQRRQRISDRLFSIAEKVRKSETSGLTLSSPIPPHIISDSIKLLGHAAKGGEKIADAMLRVYELIENSIGKKLSDSDKSKVEKYFNDILKESELPEVDTTEPLSTAVLKELVFKGYDTPELLFAKVKEFYPKGTSDRDIRDSITNYGKEILETQSEIGQKVSAIKSVWGKLSQLEDALSGKLPFRRSAPENKQFRDERRRLTNELKEAMKNLDVPDVPMEDKWQTRIEASKKRYLNAMNDMLDAIDKKSAIVKNKRTEISDAEIKRLKEEYETVKSFYDEAFGQKEKVQLESLDRSIDRIESLISDADLEIKRKPKEKETLAVIAKREVYDNAKKELLKAREEAGIVEKEQLRKRAEYLEKRNEYYKNRQKTGDYSKKKRKKSPTSERINKLLGENDLLKFEEQKLMYQAEQQALSKWGKARNLIADIWNIPRIQMATGELSFIGVQGRRLSGSYLLKDPKVVKEAIKTMWKAMGSKEGLAEVMSKIKNDDPSLYHAMKASKLDLTETSFKVAATEENTQRIGGAFLWNIVMNNAIIPLAKGVDFITGKDVATIAKELKEKPPYEIFERGAVAYNNYLRAKAFTDFDALMKMDGKSFETNEKEYKLLANYLNTATGRGKLPLGLESQAELLAKLLFSPRNFSSELQLSTTPFGIGKLASMQAQSDMPLKNLTKEVSAVKEAAKHQVRYQILQTGLGLTLTGILYGLMGSTDDNEDGTGVELDPRSTKFGSITFEDGKIVDFFNGGLRYAILASRIGSQKYKTADKVKMYNDTPYYQKGQLKDLGEGYIPDGFDLFMQIAANKVNPSLGTAFKIYKAKPKTELDKAIGVKRDRFGNRVDFETTFKELMMPIYFTSIKESIQNDPSALDVVGQLQAFLALASYRNQNKEKQAREEQEKVKKDLELYNKKRAMGLIK